MVKYMVVSLHGMTLIGECAQDVKSLAENGGELENVWSMHTMLIPVRNGVSHAVKILPLHANRGPTKACYIPAGAFCYEPEEEQQQVYRDMVEETISMLKVVKAAEAGVLVPEPRVDFVPKKMH